MNVRWTSTLILHEAMSWILLNQLRLRFCHSCEVSAVNLLKQREHIPDMGIGSSLCDTRKLWERQWQVVFQKVNKNLRTLVCRWRNNLEDHCNGYDGSCACSFGFYSQPKKVSINENKGWLVSWYYGTQKDEQTIVVRWAPVAGSSCMQPVNHTLSKIINSHIMDKNFLLRSTANGYSELWILVFWVELTL